jgi:hypothetical protein
MDKFQMANQKIGNECDPYLSPDCIWTGFNIDERAICYAALFAELVLSHLVACKVHFKRSRAQTDNSSEFTGYWNAENNSIFTKTVESFKGISHTRIPPITQTRQSDVETFKNRQDFLVKAVVYILWFNVARKNWYKGNKTPYEIIQKRNPNLNL